MCRLLKAWNPPAGRSVFSPPFTPVDGFVYDCERRDFLTFSGRVLAEATEDSLSTKPIRPYWAQTARPSHCNTI